MFTKIDYPFLIATFVSFLVSVALWFLVSRDYGVFVGLWVPSILALWVGYALPCSLPRLFGHAVDKGPYGLHHRHFPSRFNCDIHRRRRTGTGGGVCAPESAYRLEIDPLPPEWAELTSNRRDVPR